MPHTKSRLYLPYISPGEPRAAHLGLLQHDRGVPPRRECVAPRRPARPRLPTVGLPLGRQRGGAAARAAAVRAAAGGGGRGRRAPAAAARVHRPRVARDGLPAGRRTAPPSTPCHRTRMCMCSCACMCMCMCTCSMCVLVYALRVHVHARVHRVQCTVRSRPRAPMPPIDCPRCLAPRCLDASPPTPRPPGTMVGGARGALRLPARRGRVRAPRGARHARRQPAGPRHLAAARQAGALSGPCVGGERLGPAPSRLGLGLGLGLGLRLEG